ncbi:hypothetical protein NE237_016008 [Protea cynaroides]|uniref:Uncharacterized protein n=1 Tax=Protea cynaroides TaxID=273540 RepID=A0A9Q0KF33_9MAGN|nr:hypothetical protein NE237_016008 [Protea cynaroides]
MLSNIWIPCSWHRISCLSFSGNLYQCFYLASHVSPLQLNVWNITCNLVVTYHIRATGTCTLYFIEEGSILGLIFYFLLENGYFWCFVFFSPEVIEMKRASDCSMDLGLLKVIQGECGLEA